MRFLPLLALLPLPAAAADDLAWQVHVFAASKYASVEFRAQLMNPGKETIAFEDGASRPAIDLILEPEGKPAVRKPLPKEAAVSKGPKEIGPSQLAWYVAGDLRLAFGRFEPGRYTLRVAAGGAVSEPAAFEVADTSLEEAKKGSTGPEGIELSEKGVLVNRRKEPLRLWAYGGDVKGRPLDALVTVQQWTGRSWTASPGGFCGTGLEEVAIPSGGRREVSVPPLPDGILRIAVSCLEWKGGKAEAIEVVSEPFLVDTFKG